MAIQFTAHPPIKLDCWTVVDFGHTGLNAYNALRFFQSVNGACRVFIILSTSFHDLILRIWLSGMIHSCVSCYKIISADSLEMFLQWKSMEKHTQTACVTLAWHRQCALSRKWEFYTLLYHRVAPRHVWHVTGETFWSANEGTCNSHASQHYSHYVSIKVISSIVKPCCDLIARFNSY